VWSPPQNESRRISRMLGVRMDTYHGLQFGDFFVFLCGI
jgi:hypothetical protein